MFRSLAWVSRLHPLAKPERHGVELLRDVPYCDTHSADHKLDVYRPLERGAACPVVLYVHGGGFTMLSKESHWVMALAFARRRFVVFNINYRLAPKHKYPAAIEDACRAYAWVARNAELYGGDPRRIVVAGESAGANLVSSIAVASSYVRPEPWARAVFETGVGPRAVVPACGLLQVTDCARFHRRRPIPGWLAGQLESVERSYLGGLGGDGAGFLDLANPLLVFERGHRPDRPLPPFFASVGTRDPLLDDTRRLKAALDKLGVRCHASFHEGEVHAFQAFVWRSATRTYWRALYAFLQECLGEPVAEIAREMPLVESELKKDPSERP
jgi:acetyl esterase